MEYSSTNEGSCPHGDCPPGSSPTKTLGLLSADDFASEFVVPGQYGSAGLILYGGKRRMPIATTRPRSCLRTRHDTRWCGVCAGAIDGSTPARCDAVQAAMASFLPAVANITNERNACAREHCSGHGRCVDYGGKGVRCACVEGWRGTACKEKA